MSDTPIWDQTAVDLDMVEGTSLACYRAYLDLAFLNIDIANPEYILSTLRSSPWVVWQEATEQQKRWEQRNGAAIRHAETSQDKADRYRER